jgi:F-type H+-transporting ATPase subunit b
MRLERTLIATTLFVAVSPAVAMAAESEGGGVFSVNPGLSVWTSVVFLALLFILHRFAWGPILAAVDAREQRIQGALDESAAQRDEAARLLAEHKTQLADARRQSSEIIAEGRAAAERLRRELEDKARVEAQGIIDGARREIRREKDRAIAELRKESVDLALAAAGKLIHEQLDDERHRALVVGFLDDMDESAAGEARA